MSDLTQLRDDCKKIIDSYESLISKRIERKGLPDGLTATEVGTEWLSRDNDGVPYSYGNYDDCYDDGFNNGCTEGEAMLAYKVWNLLKED